jgi:hypothetical protein
MTDTSNNDSIGKALNISPMEDQVKQIIAKGSDDSALADFNIARTNIHEIIQNGTFAIEKLSQIADQSQHPRAFEVLGGLYKVMLDANKDLMDLQKKVREIQAVDEPHNQDAKSITNNLFVGSTAELQKVLENMKNGTADKEL